jgi:hypothetical protein
MPMRDLDAIDFPGSLDAALRRGSTVLAPAAESRFMRVRMGVGELFEVLKTGAIVTLSSSIPRTARVRHVSYSDQNRCFELLIEDASFEPVKDLTRVPMVEGPVFVIFTHDFAPLREFIETHAAHLAPQLPAEYADMRHLAAAPDSAPFHFPLEERD